MLRINLPMSLLKLLQLDTGYSIYLF